MKHEELIMHY